MPLKPSACSRLTRLSALVGSALLALAATVPARAQTSWTGITSNDWFTPGNWTAGVPAAGVGTFINTISPNPTVLDGKAVGGPVGATGDIAVGGSGVGMLTISNGATLTSTQGLLGGDNLGGTGTGTVTVTGPGSTWSVIGGVVGGDLVVGFQGTGTLRIESGGSVSSSSGTIGAVVDAAGTGTVTVTGLESAWNINGPLSVDIGTLAIQNGGTVSNGSGEVGGAPGFKGAVTVTGAQSSWNNSIELLVGFTGLGVLTIADGGTVSAPSTTVGKGEGSVGTINIGAPPGSPPVAPGTLNTPSVLFGNDEGDPPGTGAINFNHTATDYVFAPAISGPGAVNVLAGTTIFTAANTYSGSTLVDGGTLKAGAVGTFSPNSEHTIAGAGTLDLAGLSQTVLGLTNAGLVNFGTGTAPGTTLTTTNYVGQGGTLAMNTFLGADASPSDKLVINGGTASGTSALSITNAGGPGAQTVADGIQVVQAVGGATTAAGAFSLAGPVAAGPFEYLLFKGGVTAGTEQSWFLRSALVAPPDGQQPPIPGPGTPPLPPPPAPGEPPIPLFRPEVSVHAVVPGLARTLGLATLGTYHERIGVENPTPGFRAWGRLLGQHTDLGFSGTVSPSFDGTIGGFQAGSDVWTFSGGGHRDHVGLYGAFAQMSGDVRGFVIGLDHAPAGRVRLDGTSLGAYWTHIGPTGWYLDGVLQHTWLDGDPRSHRGIRADTEGDTFAASLEGGYPVPIWYGLTFEPQAQAIWQHLSLDNTADRFSPIAFDTDDAWTGRVGARLGGRYASPWGLWLPYLKANVWWGSGGSDTALFAGFPIAAGDRSTSLELGGGLTAKLAPSVSLYGDASYLWNIDGQDMETWRGSVGVRVTW